MNPVQEGKTLASAQENGARHPRQHLYMKLKYSILHGIVALALCAQALAGSVMRPTHAPKAMVASVQPDASDAGVEVMKAGGNAVDAAVAVGFALAVTHPQAGNLGGGGFALIRMADGTSAFVDFREVAPLKATHDMYIGPDGNPTKESLVGWRAAGVPGSVMGLADLYKRFGTKKWADLLAPAVR